MTFDTSIQKHTFTSTLGDITIAATDRGLAGAWFAHQRHLPDMSRWPENPDHPLLQQAQAQLEEYFAGRRNRFDLPLDLRGGTPFQQSIWNALLAIPFGATTSYSRLGTQVGKAKAVRAVGAAVGRNPLSIIVPCHRVMGSDGSLTGYAGGLDRKAALLKLETSPA